MMLKLDMTLAEKCLRACTFTFCKYVDIREEERERGRGREREGRWTLILDYVSYLRCDAAFSYSRARAIVIYL